MSSRILVLVCEDGVSFPLFHRSTPSQGIVAYRDACDVSLPETIDTSNVDVAFFDVPDGTMAGVAFWEAVTGIIQKYYPEYEGFVVLSDANAMAEAASALTFSIQRVGKPIIFTENMPRKTNMGSEVEFRPDSRSLVRWSGDLAMALSLGSDDISGVYVLSGHKLIQGVRAVHTRADWYGFDLFEEDLPVVVEGRSDRQPSFACKFNPNIFHVLIAPGFPLECLWNLVDVNAGACGIILEDVGRYSVIPHWCADLFNHGASRDCPIVWTLAGGAQAPVDESMVRLAEQQFPALTVVSGMAKPALRAKFSWVLGHNTKLGEVRDRMLRDFAEEIVGRPSPVLLGVDMGMATRSGEYPRPV